MHATTSRLQWHLFVNQAPWLQAIIIAVVRIVWLGIHLNGYHLLVLTVTVRDNYELCKVWVDDCQRRRIFTRGPFKLVHFYAEKLALCCMEIHLKKKSFLYDSFTSVWCISIHARPFILQYTPLHTRNSVNLVLHMSSIREHSFTDCVQEDDYIYCIFNILFVEGFVKLYCLSSNVRTAQQQQVAHFILASAITPPFQSSTCSLCNKLVL